TAPHDHFIGCLVRPRPLALRRDTPRGYRMTATGGPALTATMRMIDRVHGDTANRRALAEPAGPACLGELDILLVRVGNRADRREAFPRNDALFTGGQTKLGIAGVLADQLDIRACGARELAALAGLHLDVMHDRADRHILQRHRIAGLDVDVAARNHLVARSDTLRRQDVGKLAVLIADQRDERRPVRVILKPLNRRGNVKLVPLEIDKTVGPLVSAAAARSEE